MDILAIDAATVTGWALGHTSARPRLETLDMSSFKDRGRGYRFELMRVWLNKMLDKHNVDLIAFEAPILTKFSNINMTRNQQGLTAIIESVAVCRKIEYIDFPPASVKKALSFTGRAKKDQMMRAAKGRGFKPMNDNEADAAGVWLCALEQFAPEQLHRFDPISVYGRW